MSVKETSKHPFFGLDMTPRELSSRSGIPLQSIYRYLSGRGQPPPSRADALAVAVDGRIPAEGWIWPERWMAREGGR